MFSGGEGPWEDDPKADGWWGDDPPFHNLKAGLLDELQIHLPPVLLGGGVRLFDQLGPDAIELEVTQVIESPSVTHLRFRVLK
jgi:hypothetical protein